MFANISHADKLAFFDLLDEYFESRPHNRPSGGGGGAAPSSGTTITPASSTHTNFSVPNTAIASVGNAARNQLMGQIRGTNGSGHQDAPGARPQATSPTGGSASSSAPAWQTAGKGLMSKGLGKAGTMASGWQSTPSDGKGPPTAPPAGRRGGGASGLTSSKTFGHVSTDSKLAFAKTLFNDPQKQQAPYQEAPRTTASPSVRQSSGLPPPPTRTVAAARASSPEPEEDEGPVAEAMYAFSSNEAGDLSVREKEVVAVITKTSDDWWTCRNRQTGQEGLVPSAYLKEL